MDISRLQFFSLSHVQCIYTGTYYWMGLTDDMVKGVWRWKSSGLQATFTDWVPGEPNNQDGIEDCANFRMDRGGRWNDISCHHNFIPVCEIRYVC